MCGHDLRIQPQRARRISWVDALLVLAVLAVLVVWWRVGTRPQQDAVEAADNQAILPTNIPLMAPTSAVTATIAPTAIPTPVSAPPEQTFVTHEVQAGETLLSIAGLYGITVDEVQSANNLSGELIRIGDRLTIPVIRTQAATSADTTGGVASRFEYTVRPNDTVISIALTFGSTPDEILAANNLAQNAIIRPGDVLIVPVRQVPPEVIASTGTISSTTTDAAPAPPASADVIYIAPRLIGPPDNVTLPSTEAALLRWISVDVLQPNEWYVLLIYPTSEGAQPFPSIWTKATSYRLDAEFAPESGQSASYTWQVSVVRVKTGANGQTVLEAASPPSTPRAFTWR
jgi:LysM repeat protein